MPKQTSNSANVAKLSPLSAFFASRLDTAESKAHVYSNSLKLPRRLSSGLLIVDWISGGGYVPGFASISGLEASGKTTLLYHTLASALTQPVVLSNFYDAEGTLNPGLAAKIWTPFGLDINTLMSDKRYGFRYYRNTVIEKMINLYVKYLEMMPEKHWIEPAQTWAYFFPKRDAHFTQLMEAMNVKPDRSLSDSNFHVAPTDNDRIEAIFTVDSFAAMITEEMEEDGQRSNRRAQEASAFSNHLKRIIGKLPSHCVLLLGTNQLRVVPGVVYGGKDDSFTEPGGNALQFYTNMRLRTYSKGVQDPFKKFKSATNSKIHVEPSVEGDGMDQYMYKEIRNTKNKNGIPLLNSHARVWVSDCNGDPRGFDPVHDVIEYLLHTNQVHFIGGKDISYKFNLYSSLGSVATMLNSLTSCSYATLKMLIIGETTHNNSLIVKACKKMGINKKPGLRKKLFSQVASDLSVYNSAMMNRKSNATNDIDSEVEVEEL